MLGWEFITIKVEVDTAISIQRRDIQTFLILNTFDEVWTVAIPGIYQQMRKYNIPFLNIVHQLQSQLELGFEEIHFLGQTSFFYPILWQIRTNLDWPIFAFICVMAGYYHLSIVHFTKRTYPLSACSKCTIARFRITCVVELDWIPAGKPKWHSGWMNGYARGLELVLNYLGHDVDYDTIIGDMGLAFIMQGEENSINIVDGAVDVGWWPLEPLGIIRLNFLEKTVEREIQDIKLPWNKTRKDPVSSYKQWFKPMVISSVENNKPCLVRVGSTWYIVTGYDDEELPLIGMCPNEEEGKEKIYRIEEPMPPYVSLAIGEVIPTIDRKKADFEALKFAIALHRDQVLGTNVEYPGEYPLRRADEFGKPSS